MGERCFKSNTYLKSHFKEIDTQNREVLTLCLQFRFLIQQRKLALYRLLSSAIYIHLHVDHETIWQDCKQKCLKSEWIIIKISDRILWKYFLLLTVFDIPQFNGSIVTAWSNQIIINKLKTCDGRCVTIWSGQCVNAAAFIYVPNFDDGIGISGH